MLAVPLTMVVKIMLENTVDLRWLAILLDKSPPQTAVGTGVPDPPEPVPADGADRPNLTEHARSADAATGDAGAA